MDGAARILAVIVTPGQMGDLRPAHGPPANLPPPARSVADAAYDSNGLRHILLGRGTTRVIPNNPPRKKPQPFDARAYKARNIVERTIGRLKACRRIYTRYDKLAANFASVVAIAITLPGWT
jgi:putative transposase